MGVVFQQVVAQSLYHESNMCIFILLTKYFADSVGISLIASTFKHTNQVVIGGIGTTILFPLLQ